MRCRCRWLIAGLLVGALACGDDDSTVDASGDSTVALDAAPDASTDGGEGGLTAADARADAGAEMDGSPDGSAADGGSDAADATTDEAAPAPLDCPDDDSLEPNNSPGMAKPLPSEPFDAISCNDLDIYYVDLEAGGVLDLTLEFSHAEGNLDLLVLADRFGVELAASRSEDDGEHIAFPVYAPGRYYVVIRSPMFAGSAKYRLTATDLPPSCPSDDVNAPNDSRETAAHMYLGGSARGGVVCGGGDDYFAVDAYAGCTGGAVVRHGGAPGSLTVTLERADGSTVTTGVDAAGVIAATTALTVAEILYVRVTGNNVPYAIEQVRTCPALCPADDAHEPNNTTASATPGGTGTGTTHYLGVMCSTAPATYDFYAPGAAEGCRQVVSVYYDYDLIKCAGETCTESPEQSVLQFIIAATPGGTVALERHVKDYAWNLSRTVERLAVEWVVSPYAVISITAPDANYEVPYHLEVTTTCPPPP